MSTMNGWCWSCVQTHFGPMITVEKRVGERVVSFSQMLSTDEASDQIYVLQIMLYLTRKAFYFSQHRGSAV